MNLSLLMSMICTWAVVVIAPPMPIQQVLLVIGITLVGQVFYYNGIASKFRHFARGKDQDGKTIRDRH